jgi:hypothetical protein
MSIVVVLVQFTIIGWKVCAGENAGTAKRIINSRAASAAVGHLQQIFPAGKKA